MAATTPTPGSRIDLLDKATPEQFGFTTRPEKNLCHYTSQEGLIGILKHKVIYATDANYMNDSLEAAYAVRLAKKYVKNQPHPQGTRELLNILNVLDQTEALAEKMPVYVASFSEEPDLLSQWRGIVPGLLGLRCACRLTA